MNEIALLTLAHLLALVYWLGADLGVFYSSFVLCDDRKSPEVRVSAAKILFALDQAPRICMTLMLPLGVHLAVLTGFQRLPSWAVAVTWGIGLAWLGMVLALHFLGHGRDLRILTRVDFWFRALLVVALLAYGALAIAGESGTATPWAGKKLVVFALLVACGLAVRIRLKPFAPAFANLVRGTPSREDNAAIRRSIGGTRPFVVAIWVGLLVNSALGVHLI
ncbi:MAG: hypothetical protein P8008_06065 [Gammaproteobacteria bacterium]